MNQNAYVPPEITEGEEKRLEELYGLRLLDTAAIQVGSASTHGGLAGVAEWLASRH